MCCVRDVHTSSHSTAMTRASQSVRSSPGILVQHTVFMCIGKSMRSCCGYKVSVTLSFISFVFIPVIDGRNICEKRSLTKINCMQKYLDSTCINDLQIN